MAFEVYHPRMRGTNNAPKPVVRLSKLSLVLNKVAREKLNNPEHLELAFDSETGSIRIRPIGTGGLAVKKTKIFAKGFFESFKIKASGNYVADFNEQENALYVNLG